MKEIPLFGKYGSGKFAIVDDEDYTELSKHRWSLTGRGYAARGDRVTMHRMINKTQPSLCTDHINQNKLDNRRRNLRSCSIMENAWNRPKRSTNTSGFRGVSFHRKSGRWQAVICVGNKKKHLGYFLSPSVASAAYERIAVATLGSFYCPLTNTTKEIIHG